MKSINKYNLIFPFSLNQRELKHTLLLKDKKTLNPCLQIIRTTMKYITNKLKTSIYYITSNRKLTLELLGTFKISPLFGFKSQTIDFL